MWISRKVRILLDFIKPYFATDIAGFYEECVCVLSDLSGPHTNNKKGQFNTKIKSANKNFANILGVLVPLIPCTKQNMHTVFLFPKIHFC